MERQKEIDLQRKWQKMPKHDKPRPGYRYPKDVPPYQFKDYERTVSPIHHAHMHTDEHTHMHTGEYADMHLHDIKMIPDHHTIVGHHATPALVTHTIEPAIIPTHIEPSYIDHDQHQLAFHETAPPALVSTETHLAFHEDPPVS